MAFDPLQLISEFVSHPSVSTDPQYANGMTSARESIAAKLEALGFTVETVATPLHPIILAERGADHDDWPHILVYGHYDVQPADPFNLWTTPPFETEIRGERIYGRGAADNKGPIAVQLTALSRVLERNPDLPLRITWMIEGEEEIGSPSFAGFLENYKERLSQADMVILSDTGCPSPDTMAITLALRGLAPLQINVTGPKQDLHSGIHGGCILNPLQALMEICASLHNPDGTVNVPGFYDDVVMPQDWERDELAKLPTSEEDYRKFLGVDDFHCPPDLNCFEATRFAPTLEFNGIGGGYQGEGEKTVIPSKAFAKITCRLVANQDAEKTQKLLAETIMERAPKGVKVDLTIHSGGPAYQVIPPGKGGTAKDDSTKSRAFDIAENAIPEIWGQAPVYLREGGSVPIIGDIKDTLGLDSLMLGLFTKEDNLHAPDESMHCKIIERGAALYERLFEGLAKQ
ncbi:M20/M25/M40 family metallo-hydrolase [Cerasicoccus frondis]|uniref:M20/M25/M40 family metallo-hydrolase n=1 Tax=Cerasicoccus frondis TaxID=490090 RepID=UPI00285249E1|nr:M20/M25/M40 family metallo-hydrolase [Cerasicoccus frondis]